MISWLQNLLQKHYKWLFTILLGVIIIAFVFTIGASPGIGRAKGKMAKSLYYGVDLNSEHEVRDLMVATNISFLLATGQALVFQAQAEQAFLQRAALIHLANTLQIPEPTEAELAAYIKTIPYFQDFQGRFNDTQYQEFLTMVKNDPVLNQQIARETIIDDYRISLVEKVLKGPGYVIPYEAQFDADKLETLWSIDVAEFDFYKFDPKIQVTEEQINEYYENHKDQYVSSEQVHASLILFKRDHYQGKVELPTDAELEAFFNKNTGMFATADGTIPQLNDVKKEATEAYMNKKAEREAGEDAFNFAYEIYDGKIQKGSPEFNQLMDKYNVTLADLPAYDKDNLLPDSSLPGALLRQAFTLSDQQFVSDVLPVEENSALLIFNGKEPSVVQPLAKVRNEVKADVLLELKAKAFQTRAEEIHKQLAEDLKDKINFSKVAAQDSVSIESFNNFTLKDSPKGLNPLILQSMLTMSTGKLSKAIITDTKVFYVYVKDKKEPEFEADNAEVQKIYKEMVPLAAEATGYATIEEFVSKGVEKSIGKN